MTTDKFLSIREKIKRAEKHFSDFKLGLGAFMDSKPYALRVDDETEPTNPVVEILKAESVPPPLLCIAGDVIHNLRSALDHFACALVRANGNIPVQKTEFPILESPITTAKLETRFAGKVEGMGQEVIDAIRNLHPYQGGNQTLWRLHRFDVIDKHNMLVAGLGHITAVNGLPRVEDQWNGNTYIGAVGVPMILHEGHKFRFTNMKVDKNTNFFAEVVFNQSDVAEGYPMILALIHFQREVKRIIGELSWGLR